MYKDFKQKTRNKFIKITDIAISKVPRTQLVGFTNEENRFIQEQHKILLAISKQDNNSEEVGILVDIIHWETWVIMGKGNVIETKDNPDAYISLKGYPKNTLLFMHNHPSTGTFSGEDFKTFCLNPSLFIITVVGNDGNVRILEKQMGFSASEALSYYKNLAEVKYKEYKNNGTLAMRELLKNCNRIGLHYKQGGVRR